MRYNERVEGLIHEFEAKLQRKLTKKEISFIFWIVKSESEEKIKRQTFRK